MLSKAKEIIMESLDKFLESLDGFFGDTSLDLSLDIKNDRTGISVGQSNGHIELSNKAYTDDRINRFCNSLSMLFYDDIYRKYDPTLYEDLTLERKEKIEQIISEGKHPVLGDLDTLFNLKPGKQVLCGVDLEVLGNTQVMIDGCFIDVVVPVNVLSEPKISFVRGNDQHNEGWYRTKISSDWVGYLWDFFKYASGSRVSSDEVLGVLNALDLYWGDDITTIWYNQDLELWQIGISTYTGLSLTIRQDKLFIDHTIDNPSGEDFTDYEINFLRDGLLFKDKGSLIDFKGLKAKVISDLDTDNYGETVSFAAEIEILKCPEFAGVTHPDSNPYAPMHVDYLNYCGEYLQRNFVDSK